MSNNKFSNIRPTLRGLSTLADRLGYESTEEFFEDNPDAIQMVLDWAEEYFEESDLAVDFDG